MKNRRFLPVVWIVAMLFAGVLTGSVARSEDGSERHDEAPHRHEQKDAAEAGRDDPVPRWENDRLSPGDQHGHTTDRKLAPMRRPGHESGMGGPGRPGRDHRSDGDTKKFRAYLKERLEILREINPDVAERVEQHLKQRGDAHPERIRMMLRERFQRIERLVHLKREDSAAYALAITDLKLERQTREAAEKLRGGRGGTEDDRAELRGMIGEHFDVRQRKYELELQRLEKRIAELRRQLETRRNHRDALEQSRFDELISTPGRPEW